MSGRQARISKALPRVKRPYSRTVPREYVEALGCYCVSEWMGRLAPRLSRRVHRARRKAGQLT